MIVPPPVSAERFPTPRGPRRRLLALLPLAAGAIIAACATAPRAPNAAVLKLTTNAPEATLWIDDRLAGRALDWGAGRVLLAGFRRIEVRQPGFFTFYKEINPRPGETVAVHAELRPEVD